MCDIEGYVNEFTGGIANSFDIGDNEVENSSANDIFEQSSGSSGNENGQINNDEIDLDSTNESIFSVDKTRNKREISSIRNGVKVDEKRHSNAFQMLMTRTKPPKPILSKQLSQEEGILPVKSRQEAKSKSKQNENRLVSAIERKNCTKRKLIEKEDELEEDESKTGRQLGSRNKIFKKSKSKDCFESNSPESNRRASVNGLHNYFNKITPEEREKERLLSLSTMVVKADVHESKSIPRTQPLALRSNNEDVKSKKRQVLNAIDDIQILRSESPPLIEAGSLQQATEPQSQPKKPKWSLRINLQSREEESDTIDGDSLSKRTKRLNNWVTSKQKGTKREVRPNQKRHEQEEGEQSDDTYVDIEILDDDTDNSSLVSNHKINDAPTIDPKFCNGSSEHNGDDNLKVIEVKKSSNDKLAPLFIKRLRPDPKVTAARHSFLHSRSPESEKKKSQRKAVIPTISMLPFPSVSHVTQVDVDIVNDAACYNMRFRMKKQSVHIPTLDSENWKHVNSSSSSSCKQLITAKEGVKVNIETALQQIEKRCPDVQEMWKTISSITNKSSPRLTPKKRGLKRKSIDRKTNQVDYENSAHIDTWTQKYKPLSTEEVVGNEEAATKLRNWLKTWKLSSRKDDYSSGEEFRCSDNSSNDSLQNNQVAVLLGPHGSGKTASVYAIAEELGYTVLEVNASSRRTGKKILKELEEATKSHRVRNNDLKALTQSKLRRNRNTPENSLILVEDVDLIFDEDDGFISAINQLSSNTKRPIIMTCRESCLHLNRMAPQQLPIYFRTVSGARAMALIELIALAETGSSIPRPCVEKLIMSGDLRKALLKLQYLSLSGPLHTVELSCSFHETLWQDTRNYLYKPNVKVTKKRSLDRNERNNPQKSKVTSLSNLTDDLDTISLVSSLIDIDDPLLNLSQVKFEPAVSLEENVDLYSHKNVRSREISEWLKCQVMHKYIGERDDVDMSTIHDLSMKKQLNIGINRALSQVSIHTLDTRVLSTDYIPTVRTICRAEDLKVRNNVKRGNRFFHYLQNLRIPSASIKPHILSAACKTMLEKPETIS